MLKKTITYEDYNGNKRTDDFYFNLTKAELTEMNFSVSGGIDTYISRIINEQDAGKIMQIFKEFILKAYGIKSDDGKRFIKNDQVREEFSQTEAYSELFMELATDAEAATAFINGIIPSDIRNAVQKENFKTLPGGVTNSVDAGSTATAE